MEILEFFEDLKSRLEKSFSFFRSFEFSTNLNPRNPKDLNSKNRYLKIAKMIQISRIPSPRVINQPSNKSTWNGYREKSWNGTKEQGREKQERGQRG